MYYGVMTHYQEFDFFKHLFNNLGVFSERNALFVQDCSKQDVRTLFNKNLLKYSQQYFILYYDFVIL